MTQFVNPNPRIGVLLSQGGASVWLYNCLNPKFGMRGIVWLQKNWPEERLRREHRNYGIKTSREWNAILSKRVVKRHNESSSATGAGLSATSETKPNK